MTQCPVLIRDVNIIFNENELRSTVTNRTVGTVVPLSCTSGHTLQGPASVTCTTGTGGAEPTWQPPGSFCLINSEVTTPVPSALSEGDIIWISVCGVVAALVFFVIIIIICCLVRKSFFPRRKTLDATGFYNETPYDYTQPNYAHNEVKHLEGYGFNHNPYHPYNGESSQIGQLTGSPYVIGSIPDYSNSLYHGQRMRMNHPSVHGRGATYSLPHPGMYYSMGSYNPGFSRQTSYSVYNN